MKPVTFHPGARADLDHEVAYYEAITFGLVLDLNHRVENAVAEIAAQPTRFGFHWQQPFRRVLLKRFPISVIYLELADTIWIAAVAHEKRRPNYWHARKMG